MITSNLNRYLSSKSTKYQKVRTYMNLRIGTSLSGYRAQIRKFM